MGVPPEKAKTCADQGPAEDGEFTDRLATNYVIEVADASGAWRVVADASDRAIKSSGDKAGQLMLAGLSASETREATRSDVCCCAGSGGTLPAQSDGDVFTRR